MLVDLNEIIDKVVSKLLVLDEINHEEYSNLSQEQQEKIGCFARDFGMNHWDWPQGIELFGLSNIPRKSLNYKNTNRNILESHKQRELV